MKLFGRLMTSSLAGFQSHLARKDQDMTRDEARRLVELAQAGAPVHGDALLVALHTTGDADRPSWQDQQDAEELVKTLRKEGLI